MMKSRTKLVIGAVLIISIALNVWLFADRVGRTPQANSEELFVCPMHPQVVQDHPGDCPICGMKLVKKSVDAGSDSFSDSLAAMVSLSPSQQIMANVAVARAETGEYKYRLSLPGRVVPVEGNQIKVSVKATGRVEKLYVSTTGESVSKGQPLFEYYSPDIGAAQRELLLAYSSGSEQKSVLVNAARAKLLSLGLSEEQIGEIHPGTPPSDYVTFISPISGFVMEKMAKEGQWMMAGMDVYEIVDLSTVWVEGAAYEPDLGKIHLGHEVAVSSSSYPGEEFRGKIIWIAPTVDVATRSLPFRISLPNTGLKLRPEMYVTARLVNREDKQVVLVPEDAVLQLGQRQVIYVQVHPGHFRAKEVIAGAAEDGKVPVYSGITPGEIVVVSGGYLIDSDAQIKSIGQMASAGRSATEPTQPRERTDMASGTGSSTGKDVYICTMCPDVVSDKPGKCPKCGMDLVKAGETGEEGDLYICTMCPDVVSDEPGKCPKCGMDLVKK